MYIYIYITYIRNANLIKRSYPLNILGDVLNDSNKPKASTFTATCSSVTKTYNNASISVEGGRGSVLRKRDNSHLTRTNTTSVNLYSRSLSVDSGIENACETKWITAPYLKVN